MKTQIILKLKEQPSLPVEAENIIPENFKDKSLEEIYSIPLLLGNQKKKIEDFFRVEIINQDDENKEADNSVKVFLNGDLSRFKYLGQGMTEGEIEIEGSVGFHAGALMKNGSLVIKGDAGDWLGTHMAGGRITVLGSAGHFIGSGYRGKTEGMTGGTILIKENAGRMVGARMRGGLIAVGGDCEDELGYKMLEGTIVVAGNSGMGIGANMKKGTIILLKTAKLLPVFYYNCNYQPTFWGLLRKDLQSKGFNLLESSENALFKRYRGDANEGGRGEVLICQLC